MDNMSLSSTITFDADVKSAPEVETFLRGFTKKLRNKGIRKATRKGAKFLLVKMKKDAPHLTGALEKSLAVRTAVRKRNKRMRKGDIGHSVTTKDNGLFVGDQFYGGFLEYGTKNRETKSGANRGAILGNFAFMRPAFWDNRRAVAKMFQADMIREITAESKKSGLPKS